MKKYTVYMHISPSNKRYVGITSTTVEQRWRNGKGYKSNEYFYRAIEKYNWNNFSHIIIAKGLTEDEAKWLEMELIKVWDSSNRDKGYNITLGGEGANGCIRTEETKKKISETHKGKVFSEETKKKMSENHANFKGENHPNYGKHLSEETRKKLSENHANFKGEKNPRAKSVICITTNAVFTTVKEGAIFYGTHSQSISKCCKGKRKSAGKLADGTPLIWRYLEIIPL